MTVAVVGGRSDQELAACVVGGCHVIGHAVGMDRSFGVLASRELCGRSVQVEAVPYVRFRHEGKMLSACERFRPRLLIVQCGNFEATPPPFRLRWSDAPERRSSPTSTEVAPDARYRLTFARRLRFRVKQLADRAIRWKGFDLERTATEIDGFLGALSQLEISRAVVLTPLRTMDPAINRYRSAVSHLVKHGCLKYGVMCIDTWECLSHPDLFLPDGVHLNSDGHKVLAASIVARLL